MNDEQQIISDILYDLYGDESSFKGEPEVINARKREKDEKSKEIVSQINNICEILESELKEVLSSNIGEMKKKIRLQVLTSIKFEIENGNKVLDNNGKINSGKISDIIKQSKEEILENIQNEKNTQSEVKENINMSNQETEDGLEKNIKEDLEHLGIKFSPEIMSEFENAIRKVNEFTRIIKEKVDSGMTSDEAIAWYFDQMSETERKKFMTQLEFVGKYELLKMLNQSKERQAEDEILQNGEAKEETPTQKATSNSGEPKKSSQGSLQQGYGSNIEKYQKQAYYKFTAIIDAVKYGKQQGFNDYYSWGENEGINIFDRELKKQITETMISYNSPEERIFNII